MEKGFSTNIKIGVLGGGQLGRMLQQKALDFGLDLAFIDPDSNAPCKEISSRFFKGDFKDFETVYSFGSFGPVHSTLFLSLGPSTLFFLRVCCLPSRQHHLAKTRY